MRKVPSEPPRFEIPDLELPVPEPRRSSSSIRAVTAPTLDLELSGPISREAIAVSYSSARAFDEDEPLLDRPFALSAASLDIAPQGSPHWPSGTTPDRQKLALDALEIRRLGDYGAPPSLGVLSPVYTLRVQLRKRALVRKVRLIQADLIQAETRRDQILADLAARLRPELEQSESFKRVLAELSEAETLASERGSLLHAISRERAADVEAVDESEVRLRIAFADVGRAVLAAGTGVSVDAETVQALREADAQVLRLVTDSELTLRALDAFDRETVRAGYAWLGSGSLLLLAYCAYALFS